MRSRRESTGKYWNSGAFWGLKANPLPILAQRVTSEKMHFAEHEKAANAQDSGLRKACECRALVLLSAPGCDNLRRCARRGRLRHELKKELMSRQADTEARMEAIMKILALVGSPRKGSNTDILVDQILRGCELKGHGSEKVYLYDYEIAPCIDCRGCKKGDYVCVLCDGMAEIYPKIEGADFIIFGTPLYWYGPTGKMKLLLDRLRPFIASGKLEGKKGVVVTPSEEGADACGCLVEMFRKSFDYLGMEFRGALLAKAYEKGEIKENQEQLKKAYEFGVGIISLNQGK